MPADALASSPHPRRRSTRAEAEEDATARHRLDVMAASVQEVVCAAGGWLADRALAGWDVNVFVPDPDDVAPLRILGVTPHRLADALLSRRAVRPPTAVAVSAHLISTDATVREHVAQVSRDVPEVTVWGAVPTGMVDRFQSVEHVPSTAARAFKIYAMRAAALDEDLVARSEVLHAGSVSARPRLTAVNGAPVLPPAAVWAPAPVPRPNRVAR
jgi:hypothetical protein